MSCHSALKSSARLMLTAVMAALVGGCGFQLRGAPPVSSALEPLAVDCSSQVPDTLCRSLREQLNLGNVRVAPVAEADYILRLRNFERDRRASAITAQAAAAEYTLRHSVDLEVVSSDRVPMVGTTRLTTSESYRYDETNVLARQREEEAPPPANGRSPCTAGDIPAGSSDPTAHRRHPGRIPAQTGR